jgi:3-oxosteroid 1-dehydrogenase
MMNMNDMTWDEIADVVVVGSGNGGFTAAITAQLLGSETIMIEKMPYFGGSSALSGGGVWIPNNPGAGVDDSADEARKYLLGIIGDRVPEERIDTFLSAGPEMLAFLEEKTRHVRYRRVDGYPDYHPEDPGGKPGGRSIEPEPIDSMLLGDDMGKMTPGALRPPGGLWILTPELRHLALAARTWKGRQTALKIAVRTMYHRLRGRRMMSCGSAGVARLRLAAKEAGVALSLETALRRLISLDGSIVGVEAERDGRAVRIGARQGVILASGGFERNTEMRERYQQGPVDGRWTMGARGNVGEGIEAGLAVGAALDLMDDAWWGPAIDLGDSALFLLIERALPGAIIVNQAGERYFNEASPYVNFVHAMYEGKGGDPFVPSFLIFDQAYRNHYPFSTIPPRRPLPAAWVSAGVVKTAPSLRVLARDIGVDPDGLEATVARHNEFARSGRDLDFGKGDSAYDRFYSDDSVKPNPNLAPIERGPFYAFRILPGDLGTKGGLVCDTKSRVLREDGTVIDGLYATGNCSASVMGNEYAGPGATLGPAMTFGYVAARDVVTRPRRLSE